MAKDKKRSIFKLILLLITALTISVTTSKVSEAITLSSCQAITTPGSYTLAQNVSSTGTCFQIQTSNVELDCAGFTIIYSISSTGQGIFASNVNNISIRNCRVIEGNNLIGPTDAIGLNGVRYSRIENTFTQAAGQNSRGIFLYAGSNFNVLNNVTARAGGYGMFFSGSSNINLTNSVAEALFPFYGDAIYTDYANNFLIKNTMAIGQGIGLNLFSSSNGFRVINVTASGRGGGIIFVASNNNEFINTTAIVKAIVPGDIGVAIGIGVTSTNNTFYDTTLISDGYWFSYGPISLTRTKFQNTTAGTIEILPTITTPSNAYIGQSELRIGFNKAFINSTAMPFLNASSKITLNNLPFSDADPVVDFNDDGTFEPCPPNICTKQSYDPATGTLVFNVSSWTSYAGEAAGDVQPPLINVVTPAFGAMVVDESSVLPGIQVTVAGNVNDDKSGVASVSVNGVAASFDGGSFSAL
ncbi:MAG: right-handed parallel beta-helix repeat-containing protein, partial [Candidatus Woesearchaeota archaeon]